MDKKTQTFTLPLSSANDWIKINAGQFALVRVAHSLTMTRTYIYDLLVALTLHVFGLDLLNDIWALLSVSE